MVRHPAFPSSPWDTRDFVAEPNATWAIRAGGENDTCQLNCAGMFTIEAETNVYAGALETPEGTRERLWGRSRIAAYL